MVSISHNKGVVLCHHYKNALTANKMVQIIETAMPEAFDKSTDSFDRRVFHGWLLSSEFQRGLEGSGRCWCTCI